MKTKEPLVKEFTLNVDKWICGDPYDRGVVTGITRGNGKTQLHNANGYSCCLGQFAKQVGFNARTLVKSDNNSPSELGKFAQTEEQEWFVSTFSKVQGNFTSINDDYEETVTVKKACIPNSFAVQFHFVQQER